MTPTELRELIESKGLTLAGAAQELGLSKRTLHNWVYRKKNLNKFAEFFVREKLKAVRPCQPTGNGSKRRVGRPWKKHTNAN